MQLHKVQYSTWKAIQPKQAGAWHVYHGTALSHRGVSLYCGNRDHVFTCEVSGADETEWAASTLPSSAEAPKKGDAIALAVGTGIARLSADGSIITKADPGTSTTSPEYYSSSFEFDGTKDIDPVTGFSVNLLKLNFHNFWAGPVKRCFLQGSTIQVCGGQFGDKISLLIISDGLNTMLGPDGVNTIFGPDGTIVKDYHDMNIPLGTMMNGWSDRIEEPDGKVGSASELFPGLEVWVRYTAVAPGARKLAIDLVSQEE